MSDLTAPHFTRKHLIELSGFTLPAAAGDNREVPPLTYEQVRTLERRGVFDDFRFVQRPDGKVLPIWRPWPRGVDRLYSALDVLAARLAAWTMRDGITSKRVAETLRGESAARPILGIAEAEYAVFTDQQSSGWIVDESGLRHLREIVARYRQPASTIKPYRLAWLGLRRDVLPRLQKVNPVWAFGRERSVGEAVAHISALPR